MVNKKKFMMGFNGSVSGAPPVTLDCIGGLPSKNKLSGNTKHTITIDGTEYVVPDGITLLEYLQTSLGSTGYSIPTTITAQETDKVIIDVNIDIYSSSGDKYLTSSSNSWIDIADGGAIWFLRFGDSVSSQAPTSGSLGQRNTYELYKEHFDINGTTTATPTYSAIGGSWFIFSPQASGDSVPCKLYSYKIINTSTNVVRFAGLPAKNSSNVLGMYDFITGTFFTNAGTGLFSAGAELPLPSANFGVKGVGEKIYDMPYELYEPQYKVTELHAQNCGKVAAWTLDWTRGSFGLFAANIADKMPSKFEMYAKGYTIGTAYVSLDNMQMVGRTGNTNVHMRNDSCADVTAFKAHLEREQIYLYYQRLTDDTWTPPTEYTAYISAPLNKVGEHADTIDFATGIVTRNIGVRALDGTENYYWDSVKLRLLVSGITLSEWCDTLDILCTHYKAAYTGYTSVQKGIGIHTDGISICIKDLDNITDRATGRDYIAAQYAAGTPVTIWYPRATPTTEQITAVPVKLARGINYLDSTNTVKASNIEAEYRSRRGGV